ncbi:MAG: hypothetical protein Q8L04_07010, partial [Ignavibacteria bacterium]|nr:hypothetical protein [Ignavibacteria bacterium]
HRLYSQQVKKLMKDTNRNMAQPIAIPLEATCNHVSSTYNLSSEIILLGIINILVLLGIIILH